MKKFSVIFLVLLMSAFLCSCKNNALIGKWYSQSDENSVTFEKNGTFEFQFWDGDSIKGSYVIKSQEENIYTITLCDKDGQEQDVEITINGDRLNLLNQIYKNKL